MPIKEKVSIYKPNEKITQHICVNYMNWKSIKGVPLQRSPHDE